MTEQRALVDMEGLGCSLGGRQIISDINLSLNSGEILGLIGPNGAGKSTLLKCLMGYYDYEGRLFVQGRSLRELKSAERASKIAYIGQQEEHQIFFTALEVVEMACYSGMDAAAGRGARARGALDYLGLGDLAHKAFNRLSGGEQQLVRFARALAQDTVILLLDEPTANLDIGHEKMVLEMLAELVREGRGAVVAIHNLNMAAEFCDRLLLMKDGGVATVGAPDEVLRREHVQPVYNTAVDIARNLSSGSLQVHPLREFRQEKDVHVHVIGGGGSSVNVTRFLVRAGFRVSGGVAHRLDSDTHLWQTLGIKMVCVEAFSDIDDRAYREACELVRAADYTVLCIFPIGSANVRNLVLAVQARQLIVLHNNDGAAAQSRSFHCPEAAGLFDQASASASLLSPGELPEFLTGLRSSGAYQ